MASVPRPADTPQAHSEGVDADRVLIAGAGLAVGYGATSHADALPGLFAQALSDLTARGTDVDVIADPAMTLETATALLPTRKLWRFDAIVLTLGTNEALGLISVRGWRERLTRLLDAVQAAAVAPARVVIVGVPDLRAATGSDDPQLDRAQALGGLFDTASAMVAADRDGVSFVSLDAPPTNYTELGEQLADAVLDGLNSTRELTRSMYRGPAGLDPEVRERERQNALDELGLLDTGPEDRFDVIVSMAQKLFGTDGAAFTVVDHDRVWHKARTANVPLEVPRNASFCDMTMAQRGAHVIRDVLLTDELPGDMTAAEDVGVRFYAGYPIEAPSGELIGALCVFDSEPRGDHDVDLALLRQLALLIEAELRVEALG